MEIKTICNFAEIFEDKITLPEAMTSLAYPKKKVGHFRVYYRNGSWWEEFFPFNIKVKSDQLMDEAKKFFGELLDEFKNLDDLIQFCEKGRAEKADETEYNIYINGEYGNYWVRLITRYNDYNIYFHIFAK